MKPESLLRLYPRAWRERYGDEFVSLLHQSGASPAQVMDVVRAAGAERVRAATGWTLSESWSDLRGTLGVIGRSAIAGTLVAILANVIAFRLHVRYGHLPSFNSRITDGVPRIAFPPTILPTLFWYSRLHWYLFLRVVLSGGPVFCLSRWLKLSRVEVGIWVAILLASSTAWQLVMFATAGDPGFPSYSRSEIWWDAWPECLSGCLYLAASTNGFWNRVLRARERVRLKSSPTDVLPRSLRLR